MTLGTDSSRLGLGEALRDLAETKTNHPDLPSSIDACEACGCMSFLYASSINLPACQEDFNPDFVDNQFRTTRDATVRNPFAKWIWGGMQYQLEHLGLTKHDLLQVLVHVSVYQGSILGTYS